VQLPAALVRLQQRSAADAENFLAALSSDPIPAASAAAAAPPSSSKPSQVSERGISNLPAWMVQEGGSSASAPTDRAGARSPLPPQSEGIKLPLPKRLETDPSNSASAAQASAAGETTAWERVGERGLSLLPAWMVQEGASAAGASQGASSVALSSPALPSNEIKIIVPKTAIEAAAAFPLLAAAAFAKLDRVDEAAGDSVGVKRPRQSSAAVMFQEVAMLLQDAEVEAAGEQQRLEALISSAVRSGDGVRNVSDALRVIFPMQYVKFVLFLPRITR